MMRLRDRLRHAFAIVPPEAFQPTAAQRDIIERLVGLARERELRVPAVLFLDSLTPLHGVAAQVLHFLQPLGDLLGVDHGWREVVTVLEQPGGCEYVLRRLETPEGPELRAGVAGDRLEAGSAPEGLAGNAAGNAAAQSARPACDRQ
ncbi:MAG: hypothetical protein ACKOGA_06730 [Planctomycetaceae bacterium]